MYNPLCPIRSFRLKWAVDHYVPASVMKKTRAPHRSKSPRAVQELSRLAAGLAASGSRIEDAFWENLLAAKIHGQLRTGDDQNLETALDQLYETDPAGYGEFIHAIEAAIECSVLTHEDRNYDVLMFAAPVLTWSRFSIPSGPIPEPMLASLRTHLQAQVLAADIQFSLADYLFSPDQLPRGYHLTHELANKLWAAATENRDLHMNPRQLAETGRFLSDTRYLLGAIAVPRGNPCSSGRSLLEPAKSGRYPRLRLRNKRYYLLGRLPAAKRSARYSKVALWNCYCRMASFPLGAWQTASLALTPCTPLSIFYSPR